MTEDEKQAEHSWIDDTYCPCQDCAKALRDKIKRLETELKEAREEAYDLGVEDGYDLYIYDQSGKYPEFGNDRESFMRNRKEKAIRDTISEGNDERPDR